MPQLNTVVLKDSSQRQFAFDLILQGPNRGCSQYFSVLLPLLETVFYHRKDATLVAYGAKGSGTIESAIG